MMLVLLPLLLLLLPLLAAAQHRPIPHDPLDFVNAKMYTVKTMMRPESFPEFPFVRHKADVGISFSGGGSRSFAATMGYLRGLHDLKLLDKVRYLSSVSGGSWATSTYVYHDLDQVSLEEFLGEPTPPERMSLLKAKVIPHKCARGYPVRNNLITILIEELLLERVDPADVWVSAIYKTFLQPAGIKKDAIAAWTRDQVASILARNPDLIGKVNFCLPCGGKPHCHDRPFLIINTAMLGPVEAVPFGLLARHYVMMDITPLYVGFPHAQVVQYPTTPKISLPLGGLVEPLAFGSPVSEDFCGMSVCPDNTTISIPLPAVPFSLANATAASSWAPGAVVAEEPLLNALDNVLLSAPYFSPLAGGASRDLFLGDGANMENQGVITLLQRGLKRIILFCNSQVPLRSREEFHAHLRLPNEKDIDYSFAALFGVQSWLPPIGQDFTHDKVFSRFDFARVVDALQRSQAKGKGCLATVTLTTVHNAWWGIKAGHEVRMTFVYMSRVYAWENKLPGSVAAQVAPHRGLQMPTMLPSNGTFKDFPHPSISLLHLTSSVVNMLADLSWWVVVNNARHFRGEIEGTFPLMEEEEEEAAAAVM
jgi:hypothetical protein